MALDEIDHVAKGYAFFDDGMRIVGGEKVGYEV